MHEAQHRGLPWASLHWFPLSLILSAPLSSLSFSSSRSPPLRAQIFMESSSSRARYIPLRSLASRLVLSRRDPGDQKRFNLRYHRWRAKPRFVSGLRWIRHMWRGPIYTKYRNRVSAALPRSIVSSAFEEYSRIIFRRARPLISLIMCFH